LANGAFSRFPALGAKLRAHGVTGELGAQMSGTESAASPAAVSTRRHVRLFGLAFENLTQPGLVERIEGALRGGERCWIATVNVNLLCLAHRDAEFREVLGRAEVRSADGMPIVWMSRLRGTPLPARVTGADLVLPLARRGAERGWRIFLCGGAAGVAERTADELRRRAPGVQVVGTACPDFPTPESLVDPAANAPLLEAIRAAAPDILLVAFGAPKQERWIDHHRRSGALAVPVAIGVGGSLDFLVGQQHRAPGWMRRTGLEWLHRALTQPGRLGPRYARDALTFARLCLRELTSGRG
jgi:N-acetylglucosaminyldiphosphoundecaprenol N-acetyl-beta-D-mannosaminyltransferase